MTRPDTVDVSQIIDSRKAGGYQIRTFLLCFVLFLIDGFDTQAIAYVAPSIARDWNIPAAQFGPIFALGLLGSTLGMMVIGWAGDQFGRKIALLPSLVLFGGASVLTSYASTSEELMALRLLTGVGLGGAMPNILAIATEYAPSKIRSSVSTVVFSGYPLGIVLGGLISSVIIPVWGWQTVFLAGGASALAAVPVAYILLPESIRFLVLRKRSPPKIAAILQRIAPGSFRADARDFVVVEQPVVGKPIVDLFTQGRARGTAMIWTLYFASLFWAYFMLNWLPLILRETAVPDRLTVLAPAILNLAGIVGCVVLGRFIDRRGPLAVMWPAYILGAAFTAAIGFVLHSAPLVLASIVLAGLFAMGAQFCIVAIASAFYGTVHRAAGIGWAIGVGRIGSIVGSLFGGAIIGRLSGPHEIFVYAALAPLFAAVIVFAMLLAGVVRPAGPG
ncbi:MAG: MFS transporter [Rhodospirillaceae bacterium]